MISGSRGVSSLKIFFVIFTVFLILSETTLAQDENPALTPLGGKTIAVPRWEPLGQVAEKQGWIAESLRVLTTEDLSRIGEFSVVSSDSYTNRLSDNEIEDQNPNEHKNAVNIINAVEGDILFIGTYQIRNQRIQLSAVFYNPATRKTIAGSSEIGKLNRIKSLQTKLVKSILREANVTLGSTEREWLNRNKNLRTGGLTFENPKNRPEILKRDDRAEGLIETVAGTEPREGAKPMAGVPVFEVHYPGIGIGYRRSRKLSYEFRASSNTDITVLGGRVYNHSFWFGNSNIFWGPQASVVDFKGEVSEGRGFLIGGFFGFEQFVTPVISLRTDLGTNFVSLEDEETGISESGVGFALNFGFTINFF